MKFRHTFIVLGILFILFAVGIYRGSTHTLERFFLAFDQQGSARVKVRYSENAINWEDGNFPADATHPNIRGVGALTDNNGVMHVLVTDESNNDVNMVWGLGPAIWDNRGASRPLHPIDSAISAEFIEQDKFVLAYRRTDGTVAVDIYDHDQRQIIMEVSPRGPENTNTYGRPIITNMNGKFLLAWRKVASNRSRLYTSIGQVESGVLTFSQIREVNIPANPSEFSTYMSSDPALSNDQNHFYLAFIREGVGSPLHGWSVVVYSSSDGINWTAHSKTLSSSVTNVTFLISLQNLMEPC